MNRRTESPSTKILAGVRPVAHTNTELYHYAERYGYQATWLPDHVIMHLEHYFWEPLVAANRKFKKDLAISRRAQDIVLAFKYKLDTSPDAPFNQAKARDLTVENVPGDPHTIAVFREEGDPYLTLVTSPYVSHKAKIQLGRCEHLTKARLNLITDTCLGLGVRACLFKYSPHDAAAVWAYREDPSGRVTFNIQPIGPNELIYATV